MSRRWLAPVLVVCMVVFGLLVYSHLPVRVPTHWGPRGNVNGYSSRAGAVFLLPAVTLGLWLLIVGLRRVDPRRANYAKFNDVFWLLINGIAAFMAVLYVFTLGYSLGWPIHMGGVVVGAVGVLFMGLGNYMPRLRSNWWIGIRTPWTLESDRVWRETHRVGGRTFVIGGAVMVLAAFLGYPARMIAMGVAAAVAAGWPVIYSYFSWRRGGGAEGRAS